MMYDNKTKDTNSRGWAINRIVERLARWGVDPAEAIVLYLAGEGHDRDTLLKRGFRDENLCAIDKDADSVRCVRDAGGLAIQGQLVHLLFCWPDDLPIHVVLADFNCGLDSHVFQLSSALLSPSVVPGAQVYINLQRGRDELGRADWWKKRTKDGNKNRALAFLNWTHNQYSRSNTEEESDSLLRLMAPVLAKEYRGNRVTMDGVVFTMPFEYSEETIKARQGCVDQFTRFWDHKATRRKIAAWRAVRTTRLRQLDLAG